MKFGKPYVTVFLASKLKFQLECNGVENLGFQKNFVCTYYLLREGAQVCSTLSSIARLSSLCARNKDKNESVISRPSVWSVAPTSSPTAARSVAPTSTSSSRQRVRARRAGTTTSALRAPRCWWPQGERRRRAQREPRGPRRGLRATQGHRHATPRPRRAAPLAERDGKSDARERKDRRHAWLPGRRELGRLARVLRDEPPRAAGGRGQKGHRRRRSPGACGASGSRSTSSVQTARRRTPSSSTCASRSGARPSSRTPRLVTSHTRRPARPCWWA